MLKQTHLRVASIIALALILPNNAIGQDFPVSALQKYDDFRPALLKYGWKPVEDPAFKNEDGTWSYGYPEVICGNSLCTANWKGNSGQELSLTLWWDSSGTYRIAPQE